MGITVPDRRLDSLDVVRAVAALMVYWHHTGMALVAPPLVVFGSNGVYLFFALSGFLLFRPLASALRGGGPMPAVAPFYLRRLIRIWPPYLVCLGLFTAVRYQTGLKPPDTVNVAAHIALIFNYLPGIDFFSINAVFWTLAIEAQFYLLLPLLVRLVGRATRGRTPAVRVYSAPALFVACGLAGRAVEGVIAPDLYGADAQILYRSVFSYLDLFGFGMAVAAYDSRSAVRPHKWGALGWLVGGCGLVLAANNLAQGEEWQATRDHATALAVPVLLGIGSASILSAALTQPAAVSRWSNVAPLLFVGRISYSLYLYHIGVQYVLFKRVNLDGVATDFHFRGFLYGLVFLAPTLAVSAAMYWCVERPCLRVIARRRERLAAP